MDQGSPRAHAPRIPEDQGSPRAHAPRIPEYLTSQYQQQDADTWQDQASAVENSPRIPEYHTSQYQEQQDADTPQDQASPVENAQWIPESLDEGSQDFTFSQQDQERPVAEDPHFPVYYTNMWLGEPYPPQPINISFPTTSAGLRVGQNQSSHVNKIEDNPNIHTPARLIQGSPNSSFIDVNLFSMFAHTNVFDSLLNPEQRTSSTQEFIHIIKFLKTNIVDQLRTNGYVDANSVHQLWKLMAQEVLKSPDKLRNVVMDAEEFFVLLLEKVLKCEPLLNVRYEENDNQSFALTLQTSPLDDDFPSVQRLLDRYCAEHNMKFTKMPACLILVMPYDYDRPGNRRRWYQRIFPNRRIYIGNNMTAKEDGKSYVLQLSSALTKHSGSYRSFHKTSGTQWVRLDSVAHLQPDNSYIPEVINIRHLNQQLGSYELSILSTETPKTIDSLYRYLRVCFYIDQSLISN